MKRYVNNKRDSKQHSSPQEIQTEKLTKLQLKRNEIMSMRNQKNVSVSAKGSIDDTSSLCWEGFVAWSERVMKR